eukprot:m.187388 g.187388  ORF g.187388 m.187388 type:complete len:56 (+) comp15606_c0_seq35:743-910(+)
MLNNLYNVLNAFSGVPILSKWNILDQNKKNSTLSNLHVVMFHHFESMNHVVYILD